MSSMRTAYTAFLLVVGLMVVFGPARPLWRLWWISADPVATNGRVVRLDCSNHGHVDYSFEIDGVAYAAGNHFIDGINCPDVKVGQPVAVYYEKGAPENNYALYPAETVGNRARTAFFTGVAFFGAFVFLGPLFLAWLWTFVSRLTGRPR